VPEFDERDELIGNVAYHLQKPVRLSPGFDERLMAAVERDAVTAGRRQAANGPAPSALRRGVRWLTRPRTVRVSPLVGLALAAGLATVMVLGGRGEERAPQGIDATDSAVQAPVRTIARRAPAGAPQFVQFVLHAPGARQVTVVGDFNDWNPTAHPLEYQGNGMWVAELPLAMGRYGYNFVVDGTKWIADPAAPAAADDDDFGTPSSVVTVGGSSS
jgi:hypothetical protein